MIFFLESFGITMLELSDMTFISDIEVMVVSNGLSVNNVVIPAVDSTESGLEVGVLNSE